jgi:hypothetical protein
LAAGASVAFSILALVFLLSALVRSRPTSSSTWRRNNLGRAGRRSDSAAAAALSSCPADDDAAVMWPVVVFGEINSAKCNGMSQRNTGTYEDLSIQTCQG